MLEIKALVRVMNFLLLTSVSCVVVWRFSCCFDVNFGTICLLLREIFLVSRASCTACYFVTYAKYVIIGNVIITVLCKESLVQH